MFLVGGFVAWSFSGDVDDAHFTGIHHRPDRSINCCKAEPAHGAARELLDLPGREGVLALPDHSAQGLSLAGLALHGATRLSATLARTQ